MGLKTGEPSNELIMTWQALKWLLFPGPVSPLWNKRIHSADNILAYTWERFQSSQHARALPTPSSPPGLPSPANRLPQIKRSSAMCLSSPYPTPPTRLHEADKRSSRSRSPHSEDSEARHVWVDSAARTPRRRLPGPRQPASVRHGQGRAIGLRAAVVLTAGPGDRGWPRYTLDDPWIRKDSP